MNCGQHGVVFVVVFQTSVHQGSVRLEDFLLSVDQLRDIVLYEYSTFTKETYGTVYILNSRVQDSVKTSVGGVNISLNTGPYDPLII